MGKKKTDRTKKARTRITYHGRSGRPEIHVTEKLRAYIMVRAKGGGTKRLYLNTKKATKEITRGLSGLRRDASNFIKKLRK